MPLPAESVALNGPHAFRALARALGQFEDFDRFVAALGQALPRASGFESARVVLDRSLVETAERFAPGVLALPLTTERGSLGRLQVGDAGERRLYSADDLHLLAGLADFLGAVLAQAQRSQDAARSRELLRLLLNQAPVGIAAYAPDRRLIVANELAQRWLGEALPPFGEIEQGGASFHLRSGGKLVYGEARHVAEAAGGAWVVVLHDLTPEQGRLLEGMQREVYRALAEGSRRSVVLLESSDGRQGALSRLPALRAALHAGELAGPYDAQRVGLVLAGGGLELRARLRKLRPLFDHATNLQVGAAELGRDGRTPEELLDAALRRFGPFAPTLQPALLIHDENPAVAATLTMVLGRDYRVVASNTAARTRELLEAEPFEGIVAELDPDRDATASSTIVQHARAVQPGIRTFFTSVQPASSLPAMPDATVIEKPFNVATLTALMREQIGR